MNFVKGIISKIQYDTELRQDVLKIGTMLVISRVFKDRDIKALDNKKFLKETFGILAGFAIYHLLIKDQIQKVAFINDKKVAKVAIKMASIIAIQKIVQRKELDVYRGSYMVAGFVGYELYKDCFDLSVFFEDQRLKIIADEFLLAGMTTLIPRVIKGGRITRRALYEVVAKTIGFSVYSLFLA